MRSAIPSISAGATVKSEQEESNVRKRAVAATPRLGDIGLK
jgi:hypothetical protein